MSFDQPRGNTSQTQYEIFLKLVNQCIECNAFQPDFIAFKFSSIECILTKYLIQCFSIIYLFEMRIMFLAQLLHNSYTILTIFFYYFF